MDKKILIFKIGALGDILMSTPFIRELRKQNKTAKIDFLIGMSSSKILENNEYINEIITFNENIFKKDIIGYFKLISKIKKQKYDKIYILDKHWIFALTAFLFRIKKRIGFLRDSFSKLFLTSHVKKGKEIKPEVDYYLELIGKNQKDTNKRLYYNLLKKDEEFIKNYLHEKKIDIYIIFINSGGVNIVTKAGVRGLKDLISSLFKKSKKSLNFQAKRLPEEKFRECLQILSKNNKILLIGGENDKNYYEKFILNKNITNTAGLFNLSQSIALMKFAKRIYTTDTGPMHMAATVNDNITAFFGPTNPKRFAPFVKNLKIIWQDSNICEEDYALYGKLPSADKKFFTKLNPKEIIQK